MNRTAVVVGLVLGLAVGLGIGYFVRLPQAQWSMYPRITVDPNSARGGEIVTVAGSGFNKTMTYYLELDDSAGRQSHLTAVAVETSNWSIQARLPTDISRGRALVSIVSLDVYGRRSVVATTTINII